MTIRPLRLEDAKDIASIYSYYVTHTSITFDTNPPDEKDMSSRLNGIYKLFPAFVAEENGQIVGYCYAHTWKEKAAYSPTIETTVYIHPKHTKKGYGTLLMKTLIEACRKQNIHALIACITYPNPNSIQMHERLGFKKVLHFKEVGKKFGQWLDVVDYEFII